MEIHTNIFLSIKFYVKSILIIQAVTRLQILPFCWFLRFWIWEMLMFFIFCYFFGHNFSRIKIQSLSICQNVQFLDTQKSTKLISRKFCLDGKYIKLLTLWTVGTTASWCTATPVFCLPLAYSDYRSMRPLWWCGNCNLWAIVGPMFPFCTMVLWNIDIFWNYVLQMYWKMKHNMFLVCR